MSKSNCYHRIKAVLNLFICFYKLTNNSFIYIFFFNLSFTKKKYIALLIFSKIIQKKTKKK